MGLKEYNGKLTGDEVIGITSEGQRYYIKLSEIKDFINQGAFVTDKKVEIEMIKEPKPEKPKPKKAVKEKE